MEKPPTTPRPAPPGDRAALAARVLIAAFAVALLADLGSLIAGAETGHRIAKPLLMPLIAAFVLVRGGPRLLVAALAFGWAGDVFLLSGAETAFLLGMGSFAVGHLCYLALFARLRGPAAPPVWTGPLYGVALVIAVALLWPGLPAGLRIPVAGYALLLTVTAWRSTALGPVAGTGGALFLISDLIIATGIADLPQPPRPDFWIMLLYSAGQGLLALGVLAAARRAVPPEP
ncbi:lysoplasmalogenase [Streptomyces sp. NPDC020875]|uniref:lysoplasmalogenase n=1 Tax=Streptomyces sp. NPDC020875 TaxID=3154898 RepID=UPI0033D1E044